MTRTQAQIEALELIDTFAWSCVKTDCEESRIELQRRIDKCRAALAAATEVGEQKPIKTVPMRNIAYEDRGDTDAAEVGEPQHSVDFLEGVAEGKAATIERCAQVARGVLLNEIGDPREREIRADHVTAAIRALKDA